MSTQPVDYAALAEQARQQVAPKVDYAALAEQARQGGPVSSGSITGTNLPSPEWLADHYGHKDDTSPQQAIDRYKGRNFIDKTLDFAQSIGVDPFVKHTEAAIDAAKSGQYAKATNEGVRAAAPIAIATIPQALAARPLATIAGLAAGGTGAAVGTGVAKSAGANPDQAELAGNITGLLTGAAGSHLPKALPLVGKAAGAVTDAIDPDLLSLFSPRAAAGLRWISKAGKVADKLSGTDSGGLAEIIQPHAEKITALSQQLADALSKANALPPEGPTATLKDVPDLRVQPSQQAPQNLLAQRKAAFQAAQQKGVQGEFQVNPPEGAAQGPTAVIRNVQGQPVAASPSAPQGVNPTVLKATGQAPATGGKLTPNMEIYNEPIVAPKPLPKPTLLEQLREWDGIRKIHAQLEDQIGKGQDELQQWIADHNQQAPGGKSTSAAATAKARFQAQRAAAEAKANAIETDPVTNNASGESSASQEAINRVSSEKAQKISRVRIDTRSGNEMPLVGVDAVDAKAGPYDVIMQRGPKGSVILDQGAKARPMPSTPQTDEEMESLLMKSVQAARAKKARAQAAGD